MRARYIGAIAGGTLGLIRGSRGLGFGLTVAEGYGFGYAYEKGSWWIALGIVGLELVGLAGLVAVGALPTESAPHPEAAQ